MNRNDYPVNYPVEDCRRGNEHIYPVSEAFQQTYQNYCSVPFSARYEKLIAWNCYVDLSRIIIEDLIEIREVVLGFAPSRDSIELINSVIAKLELNTKIDDEYCQAMGIGKRK